MLYSRPLWKGFYFIKSPIFVFFEMEVDLILRMFYRNKRMRIKHMAELFICKESDILNSSEVCHNRHSPKSVQQKFSVVKARSHLVDFLIGMQLQALAWHRPPNPLHSPNQSTVWWGCWSRQEQPSPSPRWMRESSSKAVPPTTRILPKTRPRWQLWAPWGTFWKLPIPPWCRSWACQNARTAASWPGRVADETEIRYKTMQSSTSATSRNRVTTLCTVGCIIRLHCL